LRGREKIHKTDYEEPRGSGDDTLWGGKKFQGEGKAQFVLRRGRGSIRRGKGGAIPAWIFACIPRGRRGGKKRQGARLNSLKANLRPHDRGAPLPITSKSRRSDVIFLSKPLGSKGTGGGP